MKGLAASLVIAVLTSHGAFAQCAATTCTVTTTSDAPVVGQTTLRDALNFANQNTVPTIINLPAGGTITLTSPLPVVATSTTINGNGVVLDGAGAFRGFIVTALAAPTIAVSISNVAIQNVVAQGGAGAQGGGGGLGAGAGLFVGNAAVTITNVTFTNAQAVGGAGSASGGAGLGGGGGGGLGGAGGTGPNGGGGGLAFGGGASTQVDGGGGGGVTSAGAASLGTGVGGAGGAGVGGVGGGGGGGGTVVGGAAGGTGAQNGNTTGNLGGNGGFGGGGGGNAGNGGFGGGGGGGGDTGTGLGGFGGGGGGGGGGTFGGGGGAGGYGGGGGAGIAGAGGPGGFAGGAGSTGTLAAPGSGGGGGALGGAVFVTPGGSLTVAGAGAESAGGVTPGAGGAGATDGAAFGSGYFLGGSGTLLFQPGAGETQTISDVIADEFGSAGAGGSWGVNVNGPGTVIFAGDNNYSGGTTISAGTLQVGDGGATGSLGTGVGPILDNGALVFNLSGTVVIREKITGTGALTQNGAAGGSLVLNGVNTYAGDTTILAGTLEVGATGSITNGGALTNSGVLQVDAGGAVTVATIFNNAGASVSNMGVIASALNNSGDVTNSGAWTGDVESNTGSIANSGTWTGAVISNAGGIANSGAWSGNLLSNTGSVVNEGTWTAPTTFTNDAGGTVTTSGTLTLTSPTAVLTNAGVFNASGTVAAPTINNTGLFNASNGPLGNGIGTFNNAGVLSLVNGSPNDTFTAMAYVGKGGVLAVDVNAATTSSDVLKVNKLSGSTSLLINTIGAAGLLSAPIPVIEAMTIAAGTTVTIGNPPGIINYSLQKAGGTFNLVSTINTSAVSATPAGIGAVVTALNTGFFQNASAFISEPPDPGRNQWNGGPWIRIAQGQNDIDSETSAQNPTETGTEPSKVRATFNGFQTGVDLGVGNVAGLGWNTHLGVTAGEVNIRTNDLLTTSISSQTQVPFLGVYGAVTGHNFFADAEVREDFYLMGVSNPAAFLNSANLYGVALAANGSVGYRLNLPSSWFIEPSAAFIYSGLHENSLRMNLDASGSSYGTLVFNPFLSALGRAGVRVGTTYVFDNIGLALQPFATGSLWHEFEGDIQTTFELPVTAVPVSITRVGTFGQIGAGLSAQVLKTGLIGYLRGDYRVGPNISGYAVVAGLRYQF